MADLYSSLPPKSYTLAEFLDKAEAFAEDGNAFLKFTLTGEVENDHQVVVDPNRNTVDADHHLRLLRDYDSLIGLTKDIVIDNALPIFPLPDPSYVLSKNIHIKCPSSMSETAAGRPMHKIPNFQLGSWSERGQINIFFPSLATGDRQSPQLSKEEKAAFYSNCLRPAVAEIMPLSVCDWPTNLPAEIFRATKPSGHLSYTTKILPSWSMRYLGQMIRDQATENGIVWAADCFFMHTIRGTKHATQHSNTVDAAESALSDYKRENSLPEAVADTGEWWIDVGMEVASEEGLCLQWSTLSHFHIVQAILQIDENKANRITSIGSTKYSRDLASHLAAVSGCRIEPGSQTQGPFEATYFQMYTTDKALTYAPDGKTYGKAMRIDTAMGAKQPPTFVIGLYNLYRDASESNASNARVEVRVPFKHALHALQYLDPNMLRQSLMAFTLRDWWLFKAYRAMGISRALYAQATGQSKFRTTPEALLLTAASVWLMNSIHSRPDDGPASRRLMDASFPITDAVDPDRNILAYRGSNRGLQVEGEEEEEQEEEEGGNNSDEQAGLPYIPFGVIFLRRIQVAVPVPRMRIGGPSLTPAAFNYFFGGPIEDIKLKYNTTGIVPREIVSARRVVTNKSRQTPTYVNLSEEPQPILFNASGNGHVLPPPEYDSGSDADEDSEPEDPAGDLDSELTQMWRQFLIDMAVKTPNPRGATNASYFKLSAARRLAVTDAVYMNENLADVWTACQYRIGGRDEWKRAFDYLFPPPGRKTSEKVQNYTKCRYFRTWKRISAAVSPAAASYIRRQLRRKVNKLKWIPHACQDKMWPTSVGMANFIRLPHGSTGPAPRLLVWREPLWAEGPIE